MGAEHYWIAPRRTIILVTVARKTLMAKQSGLTRSHLQGVMWS